MGDQFTAHDVVHEAVGAVARQRSLAGEMAVAQHGEGVGDLVDLVQAVGDVEDAVASVAQGVQHGEQAGAVRGREAGGRLVENDELRLCRQGAGDGDQRSLGRSEVGDPGVGVEVAGDGLSAPRRNAAGSDARRSVRRGAESRCPARRSRRPSSTPRDRGLGG